MDEVLRASQTYGGTARGIACIRRANTSELAAASLVDQHRAGERHTRKDRHQGSVEELHRGVSVDDLV